MKKVIFFALAVLCVFSACQEIETPVDGMTITVDKTVIESDGKDMATFTITDKDGNIRPKLEDKDNHSIDATRYSLELDMKTHGRERTYNSR